MNLTQSEYDKASKVYTIIDSDKIPLNGMAHRIAEAMLQEHGFYGYKLGTDQELILLINKTAKGKDFELEDFDQDLFSKPEQWKGDLKAILQKYEDMDESYENCNKLRAELESIGYFMDYGLDAIPLDLRKLLLER